MRRPLVTRYTPDRTLSVERQIAVDHAFTTLATDATIHRDLGNSYRARRCAEECRALLKAFGQRLALRREISVAQQERILADFRARYTPVTS